MAIILIICSDSRLIESYFHSIGRLWHLILHINRVPFIVCTISIDMCFPTLFGLRKGECSVDRRLCHPCDLIWDIYRHHIIYTRFCCSTLIHHKDIIQVIVTKEHNDVIWCIRLIYHQVLALHRDSILWSWQWSWHRHNVQYSILAVERECSVVTQCTISQVISINHQVSFQHLLLYALVKHLGIIHIKVSIGISTFDSRRVYSQYHIYIVVVTIQDILTIRDSKGCIGESVFYCRFWAICAMHDVQDICSVVSIVRDSSIEYDFFQAVAHLLLHNSHSDIRRINLVEWFSRLIPAPCPVPTNIVVSESTAVVVLWSIPAQAEGIAIRLHCDIPLARFCFVLRLYQERTTIQVYCSSFNLLYCADNVFVCCSKCRLCHLSWCRASASPTAICRAICRDAGFTSALYAAISCTRWARRLSAAAVSPCRRLLPRSATASILSGCRAWRMRSLSPSAILWPRGIIYLFWRTWHPTGAR